MLNHKKFLMYSVAMEPSHPSCSSFWNPSQRTAQCLIRPRNFENPEMWHFGTPLNSSISGQEFMTQHEQETDRICFKNPYASTIWSEACLFSTVSGCFVGKTKQVVIQTKIDSLNDLKLRSFGAVLHQVIWRMHVRWGWLKTNDMGVSKNRGTPKWMIWGYHYFWKHPHPNNWNHHLDGSFDGNLSTWHVLM